MIAQGDIVLAVSELAKRYGRIEALRGVSFEVSRGGCLGLIGPNGAGKSTTLELLEGLIPPSGGSICFRGRPLGSWYRERIGIVFQTTALQDHLTVRENLQFFAAMYPKRRSIGELSRLCMLEDLLERDPRKLSGGQRQRLLLAIALVNDPELIFLDEPTTGLDPQARRRFWDLLHDIKKSGVTIVISTHYMEEVLALCDEILMMDRGRVIAHGGPRELLSRHFNDAFIELPAAERCKLADAALTCQSDGATLTIRTPDVNRAIERLQAAGVSLKSMRVRAGTLEELFLSMTGPELRA